MDTTVNADQALLRDLIDNDHLGAKLIALWSRLTTGYIYELTTGNRVVPIRIFQAVLHHIDPLQHTKPGIYWPIAAPIVRLLIDGSSLIVMPHDVLPTNGEPLSDQLQATAEVLKGVGAMVQSLSEIYKDGVLDAADDPNVEEFITQSDYAISRLIAVQLRIRHERQAARRNPQSPSSNPQSDQGGLV